MVSDISYLLLIAEAVQGNSDLRLWDDHLFDLFLIILFLNDRLGLYILALIEHFLIFIILIDIGSSQFFIAQ